MKVLLYTFPGGKPFDDNDITGSIRKVIRGVTPEEMLPGTYELDPGYSDPPNKYELAVSAILVTLEVSVLPGKKEAKERGTRYLLPYEYQEVPILSRGRVKNKRKVYIHLLVRVDESEPAQTEN